MRNLESLSFLNLLDNPISFLSRSIKELDQIGISLANFRPKVNKKAKRSETSLRRAVKSLLNAQFLGQPWEIIEAPKLDKAPVKFFLISNSVNNVSVKYFHIK